MSDNDRVEISIVVELLSTLFLYVLPPFAVSRRFFSLYYLSIDSSGLKSSKDGPSSLMRKHELTTFQPVLVISFDPGHP